MYSKISNIEKSLSTNINSMKWTLRMFQPTLWTIIKIILCIFRQNIGTPFLPFEIVNHTTPFCFESSQKNYSPPPTPSTLVSAYLRVEDKFIGFFWGRNLGVAVVKKSQRWLISTVWTPGDLGRPLYNPW